MILCHRAVAPLIGARSNATTITFSQFGATSNINIVLLLVSLWESKERSRAPCSRTAGEAHSAISSDAQNSPPFHARLGAPPQNLSSETDRLSDRLGFSIEMIDSARLDRLVLAAPATTEAARNSEVTSVNQLRASGQPVAAWQQGRFAPIRHHQLATRSLWIVPHSPDSRWSAPSSRRRQRPRALPRRVSRRTRSWSARVEDP